VRGDLVREQVAVRGAALAIDLGGTVAAPVLFVRGLTLPDKGLAVGGRRLALGAVRGSLVLDLSGPGTVVRDLALAAPRLGKFSGSLDWQGSPEASSARLTAKAVPLDAAGPLLRDLGALPPGVPSLSGTAGLALGLDKGRLAANATFRDVAFASEDGTILADKGAGSLGLSVSFTGQRPFAAALGLTGGQLLWGTTYLDFGAEDLGLAARGRAPGQGLEIEGLEEAAGTLRLGRLAKVGFSEGRLAPGDGTWSARVAVNEPDLPGLSRLFLVEPRAFTDPAWNDFALGGRLWADLRLAGTAGGLGVSGKLGLADVSFTAPGGMTAGEGISLDLPLAYRFGANATLPKALPDTAPEAWGRLRADVLALPTGNATGLDVALRLTPNTLATRGGPALPLPGGGRLVLSDIAVREPLSAAFSAACAVRIEPLDLAGLDTGAPLSGRIGGDLGRVTLTAGRLEAEGGLGGTLWGGEVAVSGLAVDKPLTRGRVLEVERATVRRMYMEQMSEALDIGRITGRLDLDLAGLVLAYGQPQAFRLTVRSVRVPGVEQEVSLKAVNSISVIGTGQGLSGMGVGVFSSFFKTFGYAGIGIESTLVNDVFTVRGLIREQGVEYLIRRPALFGINVINRNPDNRIRFSDMVERISRVIGGGAQTGPSGE